MTARLRHHIANNVVGYLALFVALGGSGYAAVGQISASDPTIHGCYRVHGGQLRIVTTKSHACAKGERAISWNKRGIDGLRGPAGANGVTGTTGTAGTNGTNGTNATSATTTVARARMTGAPVTSVAFASGATAVPLVANTWTQAAGETDMIVGHINYDSPSPVDCPTPALGHGLELDLTVGAKTFQIFMFGEFGAGFDRPIPNEIGDLTGVPNVLPVLPEPGADTPRTLVATIRDNCNPTGHYTVNALDLDVIRLS